VESITGKSQEIGKTTRLDDHEGYSPVIPPELRPLVPLMEVVLATSDLNDLIERVIIRNNRSKKNWVEINRQPEVILRNEDTYASGSVEFFYSITL